MLISTAGFRPRASPKNQAYSQLQHSSYIISNNYIHVLKQNILQHSAKSKANYLEEVICWFEALVNVHKKKPKSLPDFITEVSVCFNVTHINIYNMPYNNKVQICCVHILLAHPLCTKHRQGGSLKGRCYGNQFCGQNRPLVHTM